MIIHPLNEDDNTVCKSNAYFIGVKNLRMFLLALRLALFTERERINAYLTVDALGDHLFSEFFVNCCVSLKEKLLTTLLNSFRRCKKFRQIQVLFIGTLLNK